VGTPADLVVLAAGPQGPRVVAAGGACAPAASAVAASGVADSVEVDSGAAEGFVASVHSSLMVKKEASTVWRNYICRT